MSRRDKPAGVSYAGGGDVCIMPRPSPIMVHTIKQRAVSLIGPRHVSYWLPTIRVYLGKGCSTQETGSAWRQSYQGGWR